MLRLALPLAAAAALLVAVAALALWLDRRRGAAAEPASPPSAPAPSPPEGDAEPAHTTLVFSPGRSGALERTAFEETIDFVPPPEALDRPPKPS